MARGDLVDWLQPAGSVGDTEGWLWHSMRHLTRINSGAKNNHAFAYQADTDSNPFMTYRAFAVVRRCRMSFVVDEPPTAHR